ncbi:MFS transporter [Seiridium cupressi]
MDPKRQSSIELSTRTPQAAEAPQSPGAVTEALVTAAYVTPPDGGGQQVKKKIRTYLVVLALFLSLFAAALDVSIVATAAPTISEELSSAVGYTWIGASFLLASVTASAIWVTLSDIWGRKIILMILLAWFALSSIVCAVANTIEVLIVGRAFQGAAGGGLVLLVHVCISDLFSLRQRSLLLGLTEGVWALAGGVGPVLGGVFASLASWRWSFWINVPISGLAACIIFFFLDVQHEYTSFSDGLKAIDWTGIFAFLGCAVMLLLGLDFGGDLFPWNSAKVFMGAEYYLPLFFQSAFESTPLQSGLLLLPFIVTTAITGILCGIFIHRTGQFRELIWTGAALLCTGMGLFISFTTQATIGQVVGFQIIGGIGSGLLFETPIIAIQSQVGQESAATATSTLNFIRNVGITLSVVVGGTVFQSSMDARADSLRASGLPDGLIQRFSGQSAMANVLSIGTVQNQAWKAAIEEAFSLAIKNMWILYTAAAFIGVVASVFVKPNYLSAEHIETVTGLKKAQ